MKNIEFMVASKEQVELNMSALIHLEMESQLPVVWTPDNFLKDLDSKWHLSKFIVQDKTIVGYAIVSKKTESSCHIHRFIIESSLRGKGFGKLLLSHLKENIAPRFDFLTLLVDSSNDSAIEFYKKNSFKPLWQIDENILMAYKGGV